MTFPKRLASIFTVVVLLCACSNDYSGLKKPLLGAQPEKQVISDGGVASRQGEWVYYINGDNFTRGEGERFHEFAGALCRMKTDGTQKDIVVDRDVSLFNIDGDKIYLCVYEGTSCVASVNIDGSDYKVLKTVDDIYYGGSYAYQDGKIYYTRDFRLYSLDCAGEKETKITDFKIYNLRAGGGRVFFTREEDENIGNLYELSDDGFHEITSTPAYLLCAEKDKAFYYMLGNGTVYEYFSGSAEPVVYGGYTEYAFTDDTYYVSASYTDENDNEISGIYAIPSGGGQKKQISENYGSCMAVCGDHLYYINKTKLNYLYRCALDGSCDECVCEEFILDNDTLDVLDKYIYFFSDGDYDRIYRIDTDTLETECVELEDVSVIG